MILILTVSYAYADFDTNPFYDQRVTLDAPPIDAITENIDPYSGNMIIVQTDLQLPGNGGLDLTLMRTYNSLIYSRRDDTLNPYYFVGQKERSTLGVGWSLHMGILRYPQAPGTTWGGEPILELPDGTKQIFFQDKNDTSRLISKDFWVMKQVGAYCDYNAHGNWNVTSPEGVVYSFTNCTAGYETTDNKRVAQVTKIQNAAGTAAINIAYGLNTQTGFTSNLKNITDSVGRVVNFTYDSTTTKLLSISTDSRTIKYAHKLNGTVDVLDTVTLPVKSALNNGTYDWKYNYDATSELTEVNYPTGGKNTYTYSDVYFYNGATCSLPYRVVTQKATSGRVITNGTWTYSYNNGGVPNKTVITSSPNNVTETYNFYGWAGGAGGAITSGNVWKVGLPISKDYNFNGITMTESYGWSQGAAVSSTVLNNTDWGCPGFLVQDNFIYAAVLSSKSVTRDGKTYTTNYSSFNTYGDPQTVTESGDVSRTKTLTYCTNTTKNIVKGKLASEAVTGSFTGTGSTTWTYGTSNDCINPTTITRNGVTTNYSYYPNCGITNDGNLCKITDANGYWTTYGWTNGRISKATNQIYYVSRNINVDGTIESETNGKFFKTTYLYDKNLRLTRITPPAGNYTGIAYATDSSTRTETRGGYSITHTFDGFGRPTGSSDNKGITTSIAYKAYGTKDYTDSNIGDKTYFDFFGRPIQVVDKDNYSEYYNYNAVNNTTVTTVTDKNQKTSTFTYNAFGNPDEKYLMSVKDQLTNLTTYSRNILGNVTGVTQGSVTRSFVYNPSKLAFLQSETNPETGTIGYVRDNVGNIYQRTDATGTATYTHDEINRLKSISKNSETISFGYDNADNKTSASSSAASITYGYDAANRLGTKTESIGGRNYITSYGYTGNDIVNSITYPSSRIINYSVNSLDQVTGITGFVNNVSYYTTGIHAGFPSSYTYANGVTTNLTYNNRQLITNIAAGAVLNIGYGYDTRGNTLTITGSRSQSFTYDNLSRLSTFNGAWGNGSFTYYANGNRWTKSLGGMTTYTYGGSTNRLDSASGTESGSYTYNGNGALTGGSWGGLTYTLDHDAFDNLTRYKSGSNVLAEFAYDGDGQRVSKTSSGKTIVYHYDQAGHIIGENDGNGNPLTDYIYLNGKLAARVVATPTITVTPTADSFGNILVNTTSTTHSITIKNTGTGALVIGSIVLTGNNPTEFSITSNNCNGQTLAANTSCTVQLVFRPVSVGAKSAVLAIPSNDSSTPTFNVTMNGAGVLPVLNISKTGSGNGSVTSTPSGISCGTACSASFTTGTSVVLTATTDSDSSFSGWSGGGCAGSGTCAVLLNSDIQVAATFNILPPVAAFSAQATTVAGPFTVNFTDQSQRATSWAWNFGDGMTSTDQNPSHTYAARGTYGVTLTATNSTGSNTVSKSVVNYIDITGIIMLLLGD